MSRDSTQEGLQVMSPTWTARAWPSLFQAMMPWSQEGGAILSSQNKYYCHSRENLIVCLFYLSPAAWEGKEGRNSE